MNADEKGQTMLFKMMARIGEKINASTGAFNLANSTPIILDLCAAPRGSVRYALQMNPSAKVDALNLSEQQGGCKIRVPFGYSNPRVSVFLIDITMLVNEFGLPNISKDVENDTNLAVHWPYTINRYDMIIC